MFDSGARFSILPLSMVKRYGLPYDPTPTKCIMANYVSVESYGEATLNVLCHGSASQILFIILERNNVLLGIDWFRANHAYVIFDEKRLVFNKREVPLNSLEENKEAVNLVEIDSVDTKFDESDFIDHWPLPSEVTNKDINLEKIEGLDDETFNKLQCMLNQHKDAFAWSCETV